MLSSKRTIKSLEAMLDSLSLERIPALKRKLNQLKKMFEKVEKIYSFDQINDLFHIKASILLKIRHIFIKLEWKKDRSDRQIPLLLDEISYRLDDMIRDKNTLEQNKHLTSLTEEVKSIIDKNTRKVEEEKLIRDIDIFMHIFRDMLEEFDHIYSALGIKNFIEEAKSTMQQHIAAFQKIFDKLNEQLHNKMIDDDLLLLYNQKKAELMYAQRELDNTVDAKIEELTKDTIEFKVTYKGAFVSDIFAEDGIKISELKLLSKEILSESDKLERSPYYLYQMSVSAKMLLMRQVLHVLQNHILNDNIIQNQWSKYVKSFGLGCFFIGGSKITLKDKSHIIVADGIASLYELLANKNLHECNPDKVQRLFDKVMECASNRIKSKGVGRYDKVNQLYHSILKLGGSDGITADKVVNFQSNILNFLQPAIEDDTLHIVRR